MAYLSGQFSLRNSANYAEIGGAWRTAAFPESGRSDHQELSEIRGRFRPLAETQGLSFTKELCVRNQLAILAHASQAARQTPVICVAVRNPRFLSTMQGP